MQVCINIVLDFSLVHRSKELYVRLKGSWNGFLYNAVDSVLAILLWCCKLSMVFLDILSNLKLYRFLVKWKDQLLKFFFSQQ